jgi:hypothetical protein
LFVIQTARSLADEITTPEGGIEVIEKLVDCIVTVNIFKEFCSIYVCI